MKHRHTPKVHFHFYFKVRNSLITAEKFQKQKKKFKLGNVINVFKISQTNVLHCMPAT